MPNTPLKIAILPIEGGAPLKVFDTPPVERPPAIIRWAPDGAAVTYVGRRNSVSNIWAQPLDGGQPKQLTNFTTGQIFNFDWSSDGKRLACARGDEIRDVVLISDFR